MLLLALADMANDEGVCWPCVGTLRERLNVGTDRAVQQILKHLEEIGYISRDMRKGHSTVYRVHVKSIVESSEAIESHRFSMTNAWQFTEWDILRSNIAPRVYARDSYTCVYCGADDDLTIDHITPQSRGGGHGIDNLVTACRSCNSSKGSKTITEWKGESYVLA